MSTRASILRRPRSVGIVAIAVGILALIAVVAACGDSAIKEDVSKDSGTSTGMADGASPDNDGGMLGPDGAIIDDCVAKPDPNVYTDLLNACTTSFKIDPHPTIPLLYADGGLPPLP